MPPVPEEWYRQAPPWFWQAAEEGDARALVCVGLWQLSKRNWDRAVFWLRPAADVGDPAAMAGLAEIYEIRSDPRRHYWRRKATELGYLDRPFQNHREILVPEADYVWILRQAAELGSGGSAWDLACLLAADGRAAEAVPWFRQAAGAGFVLAAVALAALLDSRGEPIEGRTWGRRGLRGRVSGAATDPEYWYSIIGTAVVTTAIVPFVQTLAGKIAEGAYAAVRNLLRRLFRDRRPDERKDGAAVQVGAGCLLVVRDVDPRLNLALHLWTDLPDHALRALADLDLNAMSDTTDGGPVHVYWNNATGQWQAFRERRPGGR